MKKALWFGAVLAAGLLLWFSGTILERQAEDLAAQKSRAAIDLQERKHNLLLVPKALEVIDRKIDQGQWPEARRLIQDLEKKAPEALVQIRYREVKALYRTCEEHLVKFLFFLKNLQGEESGEERDLASSACSQARDLAAKFGGQGLAEERFPFLFALGNINVRRAMLAVSSEEQLTALGGAIESYIGALALKDDYETKFNLELLLAINEKAREAASRDKKLLSPENFKLAPNSEGGGASPGGTGKSRL